MYADRELPKIKKVPLADLEHNWENHDPRHNRWGVERSTILSKKEPVSDGAAETADEDWTKQASSYTESPGTRDRGSLGAPSAERREEPKRYRAQNPEELSAQSGLGPSGSKRRKIQWSKKTPGEAPAMALLLEHVERRSALVGNRIVPRLSGQEAVVKTVPVSGSDMGYFSSHHDKSKYNVQLTPVQVSHLVAMILPLEDANAMNWADLYGLYERAVELGPSRAKLRRIDQQINPHSAARHSLVKWISNVCSDMGWTIPSCYAAIATLDAYLIAAEHSVKTEDLSKIAAACLYYSSQMQETAVDENIIAVERFLNFCPDVGNTREFIENQVHIGDTLQGDNFALKTPHDLYLMFLARVQQQAGGNGKALFKFLVFKGLLPNLYNSLHVATLYYYYYIGLSRWVSGPVWVFCGLLHSITSMVTESTANIDLLLALWGQPRKASSTEDKVARIGLILFEILSDASDICDGGELEDCLVPDYAWVASVMQQILKSPPHGRVNDENAPPGGSPQGVFSTRITGDDPLAFMGSSSPPRRTPPPADQHPPLKSPFIVAHLEECLAITEQCFYRALKLIQGTSMEHLCNPKTAWSMNVELGSSCVMAAKASRKAVDFEKEREKRLLTYSPSPWDVMPDDHGVLTIDCIRPQVLWIHKHPVHVFDTASSLLPTSAKFHKSASHENFAKMKKQAQVALEACRDSPTLLSQGPAEAPSHGPASPPVVTAPGLARVGRQSVCAEMGVPSKHQGRSSICAPERPPYMDPAGDEAG